MRCERSEILKMFLESDVLKEYTDMTEEQLAAVNFERDCEDDVVNSSKKMIFSYCKGDTHLITLRTINTYIQDGIKK